MFPVLIMRVSTDAQAVTKNSSTEFIDRYAWRANQAGATTTASAASPCANR